MLSEELRESLKRLMEPFLKEAQVVLVDLNVHRYHGNFNIEILADKLRDCCEMVSFRHSERSEESFPEEILRRFAPQNDADRHFATAPLSGGITLQECGRLNRAMRDAIEAQNLIAENYTLEVSSPGLDRPLKTTGDFLRVMGREVHIFLLEPIGNKFEYTGIVSKIENENLTIDTSQEEVFIPIQNINKALRKDIGYGE